MIDVRAKGAEGERQVAKILNAIIREVMEELNCDEERIKDATVDIVQRNQNQSAVGGNDLSNTFGMSIEIKRQEALAVNQWWAQTVAAAERNNELPVLMFRQNRKPWRVRTWVWLSEPTEHGSWRYRRIAAEFDMDEFKAWFRAWVKGRLMSGYEVKI